MAQRRKKRASERSPEARQGDPSEKHPRLDSLLAGLGLVESRERARALVMAGAVLVDGHVVDKAGKRIRGDAEIRIRGREQPYVSRGGIKLEGALQDLGADVAGSTVLDVGASTGGFTDCLLAAGAKKVYAVDVGYGQLHWRLRQDTRVVPIERKNIRFIQPGEVGEKIDLAVVDVSFISLKLVLPAIVPIMAPGGRILALIKPQFEVGKGEVGKGGVVRDPVLLNRVVEEIRDFSESIGLEDLGSCPSRIKGPKGNQEFFLFVKIPS